MEHVDLDSRREVFVVGFAGSVDRRPD